MVFMLAKQNTVNPPNEQFRGNAESTHSRRKKFKKTFFVMELSQPCYAVTNNNPSPLLIFSLSLASKILSTVNDHHNKSMVIHQCLQSWINTISLSTENEGVTNKSRSRIIICSFWELPLLWKAMRIYLASTHIVSTNLSAVQDFVHLWAYCSTHGTT